MTSDQQRQFEHVWPALSVRLHRLLSRKKVSSWLAEDLVQETGLRLIRMWPDIDQAKPLWPLTATIALNLFRDEMRRAGSSETIQALPDSPSSENVEERGMARVELRAVGGALAQMPPLQRDAILAGLSAGTVASPLASSARMLRMRARRRLQHLMDHASVLGVAVGMQMRRAARELELVISRVLPTDAERVTAAAISLLAAISFGVAVAPPSSSETDRASGAPGSATMGDGAPAGASFSSRSAILSASPERVRGALVSSMQADRDASSDRDRVSGDRETDTDSGDNGSEDFPGTFRYALEITEDTYLRGGVGADVFGGGDPNKNADAFTKSPGSFNCTVAPGHTGASCVANETGSEPTGVRARYQGEARVAGRRIL